jgi:hypothetical protein
VENYYFSVKFDCHTGPLFLKLGVFVRIYENSRSYLVIGKVKSKAIPLQSLASPEASRRLRFPDFKTVGT